MRHSLLTLEAINFNLIWESGKIYKCTSQINFALNSSEIDFPLFVTYVIDLTLLSNIHKNFTKMI